MVCAAALFLLKKGGGISAATIQPAKKLFLGRLTEVKGGPKPSKPKA
jgi:hypothetical protein